MAMMAMMMTMMITRMMTVMPIMIVMTMKVAQTVGSVLAFIQKADGRAVVHRNLSGPVCRVQTFEYWEYRGLSTTTSWRAKYITKQQFAGVW